MNVLARATTRLAVTAVAAALIGVTAAPAQAARLTVPDDRGDLVKVDEGGGNPRPAPDVTVGDAVSTTLRHTRHRVVVRVRFAELTRTGKRLNVWADLRDESGRLRTVGVEATRHDRGGHTILMTRRGADIRCRVGHRVDYRRDVVRVSVPRRCLGGPETVQFRVLTEYVRHSWAYAFLDNALGGDLDDRSWTAPLPRG